MELVRATKIGFSYLSDTPSSLGAAGQTLIVNTAGNALEFSPSIVDISQVGDWARKDGGTAADISDPTAGTGNAVLRYDGTNYAFVNADTLAVKLGAGDNVSVTSVSTTGDLQVGGNTTLGSATDDNITVNGRFMSDLVPDGNNTRDLGSNTQRWKDVHTTQVSLSGTSVNDVVISSDTFADNDTSIPTTKAVIDYVGSTEAGGSIVINTTPKTVPTGVLAIVTDSGVTTLYRAKGQQSDVILTTDFDLTANWEEIQTGGGAGTVTNNNFTVTTAQRLSGDLTLTVSVASEDQLSIFINGVYQVKSAYSVLGDVLSFGANELPTGSNVEVIIGSSVNFAGGVLTDVTASGTIEANDFVGDGSALTGISSASHDHEGIYTEPKVGTTTTEGFRFGTSGTGASKSLVMIYRNGSGTDATLASILVSDILQGFPIDSWTT